ncbi:hypothetical protein ACFLWI_04995 [Chloroflexota bacterium]
MTKQNNLLLEYLACPTKASQYCSFFLQDDGDFSPWRIVDASVEMPRDLPLFPKVERNGHQVSSSTNGQSMGASHMSIITNKWQRVDSNQQPRDVEQRFATSHVRQKVACNVIVITSPVILCSIWQ